MLTARGAALLVGALLLWLAGRMFGVPELFIAAATIAVLPAVGAATVAVTSTTVSARRSVLNPRLLHGGSGEVRVLLRNESRLPAAVLLIEESCDYALRPREGDHAGREPRFVLSALPPGRVATLTYPIAGGTRGRHTVGPLHVRVRDPFGTVERLRRYPSIDEVLVYPRVQRLKGHVQRASRGQADTSPAHRLVNAGDEFYTMREYVTGDDLRHVHWPSTAHRQRLMIRQNELPWRPQATVFCDTRLAAHLGDGEDSAFERTVSAAASLIWHFADRDYELRMATDVDGRPAHPQVIGELLDRLAEIQPSSLQSIAPALLRLRSSGSEGLLAALVAPPPGDEPIATHPDTQALLQAGRGFTGRMALVVAPPDRHAAERATELAGMLRASRWRAGTWSGGERLAQVWSSLVQMRARVS